VTMKENIHALNASKVDGPEVNTEKTKQMWLDLRSSQQ
jgi:hypothetical protein